MIQINSNKTIKNQTVLRLNSCNIVYGHTIQNINKVI